ncbi:CGGC domain-containing protein [Salidesulfovibrio onnuriiensis]|uniref:CGGC domain-containing protein n=1 Tax=Salidesulfovibrio onnuriiensis TaxID=2583823 RepID=UPI0011C8EA82|nr:CGGC domain-containing protein [Salidesulfovibrio onnuriiensis]
MEKILILGCKNTMDDVCIGCSRCIVGFNKKAGSFSAYQDAEAELIGLLGCGGCPGASIVPRLAQMKLWNAPMGEIPTKIHIAPCIASHCPHKDVIIQKVKKLSGIEVIEGTHPYLPEDIFA